MLGPLFVKLLREVPIPPVNDGASTTLVTEEAWWHEY
jgi:hypothetical protein